HGRRAGLGVDDHDRPGRLTLETSQRASQGPGIIDDPFGDHLVAGPQNHGYSQAEFGDEPIIAVDVDLDQVDP
ncbi:MAG: hypothetical protein WCE80_06030, partial [Acidimicrobiia bacterium]